jgi:hypothetical protein
MDRNSLTLHVCTCTCVQHETHEIKVVGTVSHPRPRARYLARISTCWIECYSAKPNSSQKPPTPSRQAARCCYLQFIFKVLSEATCSQMVWYMIDESDNNGTKVVANSSLDSVLSQTKLLHHHQKRTSSHLSRSLKSSKVKTFQGI